MKTTVRNLVMSFVLVGGMVLAVPSMAQSSRHRSGDRPQVSRSSERSSATRSESRPQVSRSSSDTRSSQGSMRSRSNDGRGATTAPQVRTETRKSETPSVQTRTATDRNRGGSVTPDRGGNGNGNGNVNPYTTRGSGRGTVRSDRERPSSQMRDNVGNRTTPPTTRMDDNHNGNGNHNGTPYGNSGGKVDNGRGNPNGNPGGSVDNGRGRGSDRGNDRGGRGSDRGGRGNDRGGHHDNDRGHGGGNQHGYGPSDRGGHTRPYNYHDHPHRDQFSWNHSHHNWGRPLPPPHRPYRPAPLRYYRPVVPVHYRPYYGAPVIDRILGLMFGTLYDMSLDYLYTNGYYIDGYQDNIIYLRDVRMLNLLWPDVMLCYDGGRLANAQFVYATTYRDRARYNRIYHDLSAVYGPPISVESGMATWFGGNTTGYVTLSMGTDYGRYYTTLSIGY